MKKLSDSDLKKILQEKLAGFEAEVPADIEPLVFDTLKAMPHAKSAKRKSMIYVLIGSLVIGSFSYYSFTEIRQKASFETSESKVSAPNESVALVKNPIAIEQQGSESPIVKTGQSINKEPITITSTPSESVSNENEGKREQTSLIVATKQEDLTNPETETKIDQPETKKKDVRLDSLRDSTTTKIVVVEKMFLTFSVQPFLNYKDIRPITDGIYLSNFGLPPSLSSQRLGIKFKTSVDYEFAHNKFISMGFSYFSYRTAFTYQGSENSNGIHTYNVINDKVQGASISLGALYPLKLLSSRKQYASLGIDLQKVYGTLLPQKTQIMVSLGYLNRLSLGKNEFRITPTINYTVTQWNYPGAVVHPYWAGLDLAYAIPIK